MAEGPFGVQVELKPKITAATLAAEVKRVAKTQTVSGAFTIPSVTIKKIDAKDAIKGLKFEIESQLKELKIGNISFGASKGKSNGTSIGSPKQSMSAELKAAQKLNDRVARDALKIQTSNGVFNTESLSAYEAKLEEVRTAYNAFVEAQKQGADTSAAASSFASAVKEADALKTKIQEEVKVISEADKQLEALRKRQAELIAAGNTEDADKLQQHINSINEAKAAIEGATAPTRELYDNLSRATVAGAQFAEGINQGAVSVKQINGAIEQMQRYLQSNPNLSEKNVKAIQDIISVLEQMKASQNYDKSFFDNQVNGFREIRIAALKAGETGASSLQKMAQKLQAFFTTKLATQAFTYIRQAVREIAKAVKDVDSAMTQLRIVTGATESQMERFFKEASSSARDLGSSVSDVLASIETFSRLGYKLSDALDLSSAATVLSNVAATSVDDATTGLTSIIKGFNIDASQAMNVADILTEVGQKYAVSASELMEALQRGGSSLQAANNSLEEAVALIAAGNASVQNASTVGTSLKTISARLRGAKAELEELGEYEEGVTLSTSALRSELLQLSGVDIMINDTTFKSTYQIIKELSEVWDNISDIDQAKILEDLAGKRNTNVVLSMINNIDDLTGAYESATNATGVAAKANEIYLDSITGRLGQLQAAFQTFSADLLDSNLVKGVVSSGTALLDILDALINSLGTLGTLSIGGGVVAFFKNLD